MRRRRSAEDAVGPVEWEEPPCLPPTYQQSVLAAPLGTKGASSVKNVRCNRSMSGRSGPTRNRASHQRTGALQPCHRQQIAWLRPGAAQGRRPLCSGSGQAPRYDRSEQDKKACQLRGHRRYPESNRSLAGCPAHGRVGASLAGTVPRTAAYLNTAVCSPRPGLGDLHRSRAKRRRHPFHAPH